MFETVVNLHADWLYLNDDLVWFDGASLQT